LVPLALVAGTVLVNLVILRSQLEPAQNLNDGVAHSLMIRWATDRIEQGHLPLDGWFPYFAMGSSRFHHAQSVPHVIAAYLGVGMGPDAAYRWVLYLLTATWPITVYAGTRLLGWGRWPAVGAALVSPVVASVGGLGHEHGAYTWHGYGVWAQLWGLWLLPLAWGLSWRAVARGQGYALAALTVGLTVAFHLIVGYLSLLAIAVWVVCTPSELWRRVLRGIVVGGGALLAASFALVPLVMDAAYTNQSPYYVGNVIRDSYGASQILRWLVSGEIFDAGRWPMLTLLVAAGTVRCVWQVRRDERSRVLLGITILSLVLYFGRPTLGPALELLPGASDLFLERMIMGVHLGGMILAGVGAAWLGGRVATAIRSRWPSLRLLAPAVVITAASLILVPAWSERIEYHDRGEQLVTAQLAADATDGRDAAALIDQAVARQDGRLYAGMRARWGDEYLVGSVPMYAVLGNRDADGIGFTFRGQGPGAEDIELFFDEANPSHYDLFNVRYVVLPATREPLVSATLLDARGRHRLWQVDTGGYLDVVDTTAPITGNRTNLGAQVQQFVLSSLPEDRLHPVIHYEGRSAEPPTLPPGTTPVGRPGRVGQQFARIAEGVFEGEVIAARKAVVLLKSAFDPRFEVTVDGEPRPLEMIAPDYMGVTVPPGRHRVQFRYVPIRFYGVLLALGLLTLAGLAVVPRLWRRRRLRAADHSSGEG
jgi:hypothetical protein